MTDAGPPTGALTRFASMGKAAAQLGLAQLRGVLATSEQEQTRAEAAAGQALFGALSRLRGTALKLAQQLSLESGLLPDAVLAQLGKSHHLAPPLGGPLVRSVLRNDLGADSWQLFADFDDRAFAAASIGQVHRAVGHDGRELAVKIRYPGIREAIDSDLKLLRHGAGLLPESHYARAAVEELAQRLGEELDYQREARWTAWFSQHLKVGGVAVPGVVADRSRTEVLTTTRLGGKHLDEWLRNRPAPETVDAAARRLLAVFARGLRGLRCLHADPNPGNVLFNDDGTIGLVDFGCIKVVSPQLAESKTAMFRALRAGDQPGLMRVYESLGVFGSVSGSRAASLRDRWLAPFEAWAAEPLRHDRFDFGANRGYCDLGRRAFRHLVGNRTEIRFPSDLLFVDRTSYGLFRLFERMGARVPVGDVLCG